MSVTCQPQNPEGPQCGNSLPKHRYEDSINKGVPGTHKHAGNQVLLHYSSQALPTSGACHHRPIKLHTASERPLLSQKSHGAGLIVPRDLHVVGQKKTKLHFQQHLYLCLISA